LLNNRERSKSRTNQINQVVGGEICECGGLLNQENHFDRFQVCLLGDSQCLMLMKSEMSLSIVDGDWV
jgi:hypothetical protein